MPQMNRQVVDFVIIVVSLVFYYKVLLVVVRESLVSYAVHAVLGYFRSPRYAVAEIENVTTLAFSVVLQMFLFCLLAASTSFEPRQLWHGSHQLTVRPVGLWRRAWLW